MKAPPPPGEALVRKIRWIEDELRKLSARITSASTTQPGPFLTFERPSSATYTESPTRTIVNAVTVTEITVDVASGTPTTVDLYVNGAPTSGQLILESGSHKIESISVTIPAGSVVSIHNADTGYSVITQLWV